MDVVVWLFASLMILFFPILTVYKITEELKPMRITKVEELAICDIQRLTERFGKMGLWLKQVAYGLDFSEIEESEEA